MKAFFCWSLFVVTCLVPVCLSASEKPDFNNPEAVLTDMRSKVDACSQAGAKCSVPCGYGLKTMKNFLKSNPGSDPSILQQRWQPCFDAYRDAGLESAETTVASGEPAGGGAGDPDFTNHAAVVASVKGLQAQCGGDPACEKECGYALKALKNFDHPEPHYAGLRKGKWEGCRTKVPGMQMQAEESADSFDPGRFVVAGVQLGGNMSAVQDRLFLLRAYGYFPQTKQEYAAVVLSRGQRSPGPDVVKNYEGTIKEETVVVHFEATGDGRVHKINFEQREPLDVDQVSAALVDRFGKPSKHQGNYLIWGCDRGPMEGFCVKANPSKTGLTIWASDEDIRESGYALYEQEVLKAKGVKSGAKF